MIRFYFILLLHTAVLMPVFLNAQQNLPSATETAKAITIGWNLGNTLEATGGETAWGNPPASQRLIDSVKAAGFNTIRIPCSWDSYADATTNQINVQWLARVKEVVDYCITRDLYVILNIHWDKGWLENNVTEAKKNEVNIKQKAYWTQIANYFKNYDGHLLFAGANEPNVEDAGQMNVLLSYHQTFIDAVRATGGNNSSRTLVVQGPSTDIEKTNNLFNTLPKDVIKDRLIVEVHYYTPYNFCLMTEDADWGKQFYYWGKNFHSTTDPDRNATYGEEEDVKKLFGYIKTKFVDQGIPVIMGEFSANRRTALTGDALKLHLASRLYFYEYISEAVLRYGMKLVYWDAGNLAVNNATLFDRKTGAIVDREAVNALMKGVQTITAAERPEIDAEQYLFSPNPFAHHFSIAGQLMEIDRILVSDITGHIVETILHPDPSVLSGVGSSWAPGLYVIQLERKGKLLHFRMIKNTYSY